MKPLTIVRDVLLSIAAIMLIASPVNGLFRDRDTEIRRLDRLTILQARIDALDTVYKKIVFDGEAKGIYQQIFRQNEVLLEYQKLLLTADLLPLDEASKIRALKAP